MKTLESELAQIQWELKIITEITAMLEGWMDKFSGDNGEQDKALRILEAWQRNCGQKASLRSQFLALQKQWTAFVGLSALQDVQVTKEKALATGRAKLELKKEESEAGIRDVGSNLAAVFHRDV
jgi:hypothetical protein